MIAGIFHEGSGLGDQLMRYVTVRTLSEDKDFEWGMLGDFKGDFFKEQPTCVRVDIQYSRWNEKATIENGLDIRSYDPEIKFVEDNTIIDGSFEDEKYWGHNLDNIRGWLKVEPLKMPDDLCVINFRGGEYSLFPDLFLPKEYWDEAITKMKEVNPNMKFHVHTDDPELAVKFFPDYPITQNIGLNWRSIRYAKYLILANSAFGIMPALLNENVKEIIAPRYWARRNLKTWARPACYYNKFKYI